MSDIFELKLKIGSSEVEIRGDYSEVKSMLLMLLEKELVKESNHINNLPVLENDNINKVNTLDLDESITKVSEKKVKSKRISSQKSAKIESIELHPAFDEASFVTRFKEFHITTLKGRIFVLLYMYKDISGEKDFSESLIHTLLDKVAIDTPKSLSVMLNNYMNRDKLIEKTEAGYKLKYVGDTYAKGLMAIE